MSIILWKPMYAKGHQRQPRHGMSWEVMVCEDHVIHTEYMTCSLSEDDYPPSPSQSKRPESASELIGCVLGGDVCAALQGKSATVQDVLDSVCRGQNAKETVRSNDT